MSAPTSPQLDDLYRRLACGVMAERRLARYDDRRATRGGGRRVTDSPLAPDDEEAYWTAERIAKAMGQ